MRASDDGGADDRFVDVDRDQLPTVLMIEEAAESERATREKFHLDVLHAAGETDAGRLEPGFFAGPETEESGVFLRIRKSGESGEFAVAADAFGQPDAARHRTEDLQVDADFVTSQGDDDEIARVGGVEEETAVGKVGFAVGAEGEGDGSGFDTYGLTENPPKYAACHDKAFTPSGHAVPRRPIAFFAREAEAQSFHMRFGVVHRNAPQVDLARRDGFGMTHNRPIMPVPVPVPVPVPAGSLRIMSGGVEEQGSKGAGE